MSGEFKILIPTKCAECGKTFNRRTAEWGWNIGPKLYCTYKCMRAAERRMIEQRKGKRKRGGVI